jgi:hypothetical protein
MLVQVSDRGFLFNLKTLAFTDIAYLLNIDQYKF